MNFDKMIIGLMSIICVICIAFLINNNSEENTINQYEITEENSINQYADFVLLETDGINAVYYDKNTKVMYFRLGHKFSKSFGITPIYNTDGTLKLYEEE